MVIINKEEGASDLRMILIIVNEVSVKDV